VSRRLAVPWAAITHASRLSSVVGATLKKIGGSPWLRRQEFIQYFNVPILVIKVLEF
jgi:hypothetical protein